MMTPDTRPLGVSIIAGIPGRHDDSRRTVRAVDPARSRELDPPFHPAGPDELEAAVAAATSSFDSFRSLAPSRRATLLRTVAGNLERNRADLVARAGFETGLPAARLEGELTRTTNQLRMFAHELELGEHQGVRINHALPDRFPVPGPDLRQRQIAIGPVLVFGASNFPFAFSTAGGDTASALAAGCPVIVKAHNSHAGTAELAAWAIVDAIRELHLPSGVFSLIYGPGTDVGQRLAAHPDIKAIAFTGSRAGGTALMRTAAQRPEPIPVFAEMSSINPVLLFPGAWDDRSVALATGFVGSLTLGSGQFCTNPGLLFVPEARADEVVRQVADVIGEARGQTMLSSGIFDAFEHGIAKVAASGSAELVGSGLPGETDHAPAPQVWSTSLDSFLSDDALQAEVFGAASLLVTYADIDQLRAALERLEGQLTITVHAADSDHADVASLVPVLERKAGRLVMNGWPTGVEVNDAVVHGGPFPATSDSRSTSVGSAAILRFQRPVAYQDFPQSLLPPAVDESNPWALPRRVDGRLRES